jgi:hypothetical protein
MRILLILAFLSLYAAALEITDQEFAFFAKYNLRNTFQEINDLQQNLDQVASDLDLLASNSESHDGANTDNSFLSRTPQPLNLEFEVSATGELMATPDQDKLYKIILKKIEHKRLAKDLQEKQELLEKQTIELLKFYKI